MTAKPVVYSSPRSPPCRSVLLTAAAIGLELDVREPTYECLHVFNPFKTIPVVNDNGVLLTDSHVIMAYFVDNYASDYKFYPKDPAKRRAIDTLLYFEAFFIFARSRLLVEPIIYGGADHVDEKFITYMQKAYDLLENRITDSTYLCGENVTIADFSLVTSVTCGMVMAPLIDERHPKIKAWLERVKKLPYYQSCAQEGHDVLRDLVQKCLLKNAKANGK